MIDVNAMDLILTQMTCLREAVKRQVDASAAEMERLDGVQLQTDAGLKVVDVDMRMQRALAAVDLTHAKLAAAAFAAKLGEEGEPHPAQDSTKLYMHSSVVMAAMENEARFEPLSTGVPSLIEWIEKTKFRPTMADEFPKAGEACDPQAGASELEKELETAANEYLTAIFDKYDIGSAGLTHDDGWIVRDGQGYEYEAKTLFGSIRKAIKAQED